MNGQLFAPAKFIPAPTTPSQSLAPLEVRGRLGPLGQGRNLERWTTAALPAFSRAGIKRCTNVGGAVVSVLQADTGLLEPVSGVEAAIHCSDELWFGVRTRNPWVGGRVFYHFWTRNP